MYMGPDLPIVFVLPYKISGISFLLELKQLFNSFRFLLSYIRIQLSREYSEGQ